MDIRSPRYTIVEHTADLGIRVRGASLRDLFENAGHALTHLMVQGPFPKETSPVRISLESLDLEDLMVRWLGEILYLFAGDHLIVSSIHLISLGPHRLEADLETSPFDPDRHKIQQEIKAVTYHQVRIAQEEDRWEATVLFDL